MKIHSPSGIIYIKSKDDNLSVSHLCISAHQDDIEIMAYSGILNCYQNPERHFCGVCVANGENSPRIGKFADYTNEQMRLVRQQEQLKAAKIGDYAAQFLLDYPSAEIGIENENIENDLKMIILATRPKVIYTHNPADSHATHVAVSLKVIKVLKSLVGEYMPEKFLGGEVWRNLDWLPDEYKIQESTAGNDNLANDILSVFESQIEGGKNYGIASISRQKAAATFSKSHSVDDTSALSNYFDLMPLLNNPSMSVSDYLTQVLRDFSDTLLSTAQKFNK